jgi:hypothetical protein
MNKVVNIEAARVKYHDIRKTKEIVSMNILSKVISSFDIDRTTKKYEKNLNHDTTTTTAT